MAPVVLDAFLLPVALRDVPAALFVRLEGHGIAEQRLGGEERNLQARVILERLYRVLGVRRRSHGAGIAASVSDGVCGERDGPGENGDPGENDKGGMKLHKES